MVNASLNWASIVGIVLAVGFMLFQSAAKTKKAEADKKDADNLSKAQDRAAENFKRNQARGKTTTTARASGSGASAAAAGASK